MTRHAVSEGELQASRADGDTAARAVAIDRGFGSEVLELHVTRFDPGRSQQRTLEGVQEIMYAADGSGSLIVDGRSDRLEPMTAAYVGAGETYEIENPGPGTLLVISAVAPQTDGGPQVDRRTVRYEDQEPLPASGDREFRYLVTDEVGCTELTQFFGIIAPGRAPDHSHVYDEVIYVLEGEGMLHIDDSHEPVGAGTCIHLPPFLEHSLENSGDGPMKVVATFHPAGDPASRAYEANE